MPASSRVPAAQPARYRQETRLPGRNADLEPFLEQYPLAIYLFFAVSGVPAFEGAVWAEFPAVGVVGELEVEQASYPLAVVSLAQGEGRLHTPVQVTLHKVGATKVDLLVVPVGEGVDTRVLQETSHQRDHADVLANALHARPQAADAAHDQVYLHPGLGGLVEEFDDVGVRERVGLARNGDALTGPRLLGLLLDQMLYLLAQG